MFMRLILVFAMLLSKLPIIVAQEDTVVKLRATQLRVHYGFIFAHSQAVQNTAGAHPRGIELETIQQRADSAVWNLCNCYPLKGWTFSYFDFNTSVLGRGFTTAYFLEPAYRLGQRAQFRFRGSAGLSYLSNPYDPLNNPTNMSYSTHLSGFLRVGVGGSLQVAPQWLVELAANYQHVSNGGLKDPNKGINWPTASLGVTYFRQHYRLPVYKRKAKSKEQRKPFIEAGFIFSAKQGHQPGGRTERTPLVGMLVQAEKQVGQISALNTGVEFYYDNALHQQLQKDTVDGSALRAGLLVGHDFLLGKFFFTQQLGLYLLNKTPYYNRIYHRWALRYQFNKRWFAGIGLKAHLQVADFIDARLLYRF
jgi:hypothetical protein